MCVMKTASVLCTILLLLSLAVAQKPCVSFSSNNSPTSHFSQNALQSAVTQSGSFDFFAIDHPGCWSVHEISSALTGTPGYAIAWVVVDGHNGFLGHGLNIGQREEFDKAMQAAAAAAIKDMQTQTPHQ